MTSGLRMDKIKLPLTQNFDKLWSDNADYIYFEESDIHPFKYSSQSFEPVNAWRLADSALLAYTSDDYAQIQFKKLKLNQFCSFSSGNTHCCVASNNHFSIVAFRGTEIQDFTGLKDLVTDVRFNLDDSSIKGKIHNGFKDALDAIWKGSSNLYGYLQQIKIDHPAMKLWFTGHSSGAALAVLAAGRFGSSQGIYTYGCPKLCNSEFAKSFPIKTNFYRFVNTNDFIPDLPFTDLAISQTTVNELPLIEDFRLPRIPMLIPKLPEQYQQLGELMYFDRNGNLISRTDSLEVFIDRFVGTANNLIGSAVDIFRLQLTNFPTSLADHAPIHYSINTRNCFIDTIR